MPEGPETRRAADRISRALSGRPVESVRFAFPKLARFQRALEGERVEEVTSRGKAMLVHFSGGLSIYSHNQLYGRWYVQKRGTQPRTGRQLRLAIHNADWSALLYSASEIAVLEREHLEKHPFLAKLGPDALDRELEPPQLAARLLDPRFRRRGLAALLLDQGFLAGLGNYLRSEILFVAGLDPALRPVDLTDAQRDRLARAALELARRSYRTRGITNDPKRSAALRAAGAPRTDVRHHVFGRDGRPCWDCGRRIRRIEAAGRRLYLCPRCQP